MMSNEDVTVRAGELADLDNVTSFGVPIVRTDGFHPYFFPGQDEFPEDHYAWWKSYYRDWIVKPWVVFLVAETSAKEIVGFAFWAYEPLATNPDNTTVAKPVGLPGLEKKPNPVLQGRCIHCWSTRRYWSITAGDTLSGKKTDNRAVSPERLAEFRAMMVEIGKRLWPENGEDYVHWICPELLVSPEHKEAIFGKLLGWGLDQAEKDKISAFAGSQLPDIGDYTAMGMSEAERFACGTAKGCWLKKSSPKW
jgi:hypothetical protein